MSQPLIRAENLMLSRQHKQVLDDISLQLHKGKITTLIGPNGCGKSSLIKILLGLEKADSGTVTRRSNVRMGYMPQRVQLNPQLPLTVTGFLKLAYQSDKQALTHWLERLSISDLAQQSVHKLSGGEWQRVLLARALLSKPQLLVLDEPVQGIDVNGQLELYRLIPQLRDELGCGVLMVSHDLHLVMAATDEVICLNGHVCCSGHPDQVSVDPAYLTMFGQQGAGAIAPYVHKHNHQHALDGHIEAADDTSNQSCCNGH